MNNTCISSSVTFRYGGPLSYSFNNDYSGCSNSGFDRNPLLYSSSFSFLPCCCSCCSNSLYNSGPIASPCYLFGLRQSNLIQWSTHKRLILNGLDRFSYGRYPTCDVDNTSSFCQKDNILKAGRVVGKGRKMGKGKFRSMAVGERFECEGSDSGFDEVEVLLSLLTEDVSDECSNVGRREQSYRKIEVVKRRNQGENNVRRWKKNVDFGGLESQSKFEYQSKMIGSKEEEMKRKEENRREKESGVMLRRRNVKVRTEDDKVNSLREGYREKAREEERMNLSRENQRERLRVEERNNLSTIQDHRERLRKDGSSCSSYYSVTSGDYETENEIQHEEEEFEEERSGGYLRHSEKSEAIVSDEVKDGIQGRGNYSREQVVDLRRKNAESVLSGASSSVEYDWRKKTEKKLSDSSVQEIKSREESAEKQLSYKEVNQANSRIAVGSYSGFDDKRQKSTSAVIVDEEVREQNDQMIGREARIKSKQSREMVETHTTDVNTYSRTGELYRKRDENYSKSQSSVRKESDYHIASEQIGSEEDYGKTSGKFTEATKVQEVDFKGTSTAVRQSGIAMRIEEDYSNTNLSTSSNREEQQQSSRASRLLDSRKKYQQLTKTVDSERTSVLRRENDVRMKKHEVNSSSSNRSYHKLRDQRSEMTRKHITTQEASDASQETTDLSITSHSNTNTSAVDDDRKRTGLIMEPASQMAVTGSILIEPASVSSTEEAASERLHGSVTESHKHTLDRSQGFHYQSSHDSRGDNGGKLSKFISDEDRLASADKLQKSSSHYVGEFVEKVRNEISSSELHQVTKTHQTKFVNEDEQTNKVYLSSSSSKVSQSKEENSRTSSHSSPGKGPSEQIWDVAEPSIQEPPEAEVVSNESPMGKAVVRRTGKSLWHMIGDIFRLHWHSRSETHSSSGKGGKTSPNQSASSETWFSGHDPEDNLSLNTKSDRISLLEESTSTSHQQEGIKSYGSQGEEPNSSNLQGDLKQTGAGLLPSSVALEKDSSVKTISFPSGGATSDVNESSLFTPSLELKVSPVVEGRSKAGEGSSSDTISQIEPSIPINKKSRRDGGDEELKRKKLGRSDQFAKDRFDEWEEAYILETEQRRIDEMFMREALLEAKKAADSWEVPVGAVLVRDGKIIARGYNLVEELRDSTAHAEINCIREASNVLRTWRLSETTLYVTLEPCPMCAGAILQARIDTVVWGAPNKLLGADGSWIRLFPNGEGGNDMESTDKPAAPVHPFHPKIAVRRRVLAAECADTMQQFFQLRRKNDKKPAESSRPSSIPISQHPSKFLNKMHHIFHTMFCL